MEPSRFFLLIFVCLISLHSGCRSSDQPELGQVSGAITLDGKPLTGVTVVFQPESGRPARGVTNNDGQYELTYIRQTKGTKVGTNRVEIAPSEEGEDAGASETGDGESQSVRSGAKAGKPKVPARYNVQSELSVQVKAGKNTFDFQLQSK